MDCLNTIDVYGTPEALAVFKKAVGEGDDVFQAEKILPVPENSSDSERMIRWDCTYCALSNFQDDRDHIVYFVDSDAPPFAIAKELERRFPEIDISWEVVEDKDEDSESEPKLRYFFNGKFVEVFKDEDEEEDACYRYSIFDKIEEIENPDPDPEQGQRFLAALAAYINSKA
jgi:hypothetical protein